MDRRFEEIRQDIISGQTAIGIELGSTRIKTVLIGRHNQPAAAGGFDWENEFVAGVWTYRLEDVWRGIQVSFRKMAEQVLEKYGVPLETAGAIGVSAMMHGYLVFDSVRLDGKLLTPFRTWRNNITGPASEVLTGLFGYPVPQRWSITHLYQAILNGEQHVSDIRFMTTLAGYVHWQLTGERVLGVDDASGVFPIDLETRSFDTRMMDAFDAQVADQALRLPWRLSQILPRVLVAGEKAGVLSADGAARLDETGRLKPGIPFCPPEGDAGTGMVATNSIAVRTGNVSAGTSVFAMIVLEKALSRAYPEIDLVTTPDGSLVAMVHSNNCTSDYDAWMGLFDEATRALGAGVSRAKLYDTLLSLVLTGDPDGGGLLAYNYVSGEHITGFEEGRPLVVRSAQSRFTLANFMRTLLFSSLGALRTGLDILFEKEGVRIDELRGHGGYFKAREVGPRIMAAAVNTPVSVLETAGEGGAWGIALLAAYMARRNAVVNVAGVADAAVAQATVETLAEFLDRQVFAGSSGMRVEPDARDVQGFNTFMTRYTAGLEIERAAVQSMKG